MRSSRLITKLMQQSWRLTRGLTLGAQGVVIDAQDRILLIRHTYRPGWHFPGGGVERHETVEAALARELRRGGRRRADGPAGAVRPLCQLSVLFPAITWRCSSRGDWEQPVAPQPNHEIAAHGFFARDALPADIGSSAARRLREVFEGDPRSLMW